MLLFLATYGEIDGVIWQDLDQVMRLRIDERSVQADAFINWALDATERRVLG
jgi:hypothetical protein